MSADEEAAIAASNVDAVWFNVSQRSIFIENEFYENYNDSSSFEYILVPEGINIFPVLNMEIPEGVTNLSSWRVGVNNLNPIYERLQEALDEVQITMDMDLPPTSYRLLLALYLPAMLLGTTLNLLLLITMLTNRKFRGDPRYSFILALAFSDFFLCNFTSPLTLWTTLKGHWPLGENTRILCKFVKASQDFPIIMSSFCIGAIACDRFRFIVQNNLPQMTANQGLIFAFLLALIGSCFVCPVFVKADLVYSSPVYLDKTLFCEVDFPKEYSYLYTLITSIAHYFATLVIVVVLYTAIICRLKTRPPSQHEEVNRRRSRTNILLACITITFFVGWAPLVIFSLIYEFAEHWLPVKSSMKSLIYALSLLSGILTPIANPILYSLFNETFRASLISQWSTCCKKSDQNQNMDQVHHQHRLDVPEANTEQIDNSSSPDKVKSNHKFISNGNNHHHKKDDLIVEKKVLILDGNHQQKDELIEEEKVLILEENASLLETAL